MLGSPGGLSARSKAAVSSMMLMLGAGGIEDEPPLGVLAVELQPFGTGRTFVCARVGLLARAAWHRTKVRDSRGRPMAHAMEGMRRGATFALVAG
mmetsp:Transcript_81863/g.179887  ORF Transcript_81863/g.179887 Transcript_81863/m.179887 type:complete len:95 (+) Transcript_81863:88-372(+)